MNPEKTPQPPDFGKLVLEEINHEAAPPPQPERRKRGIPQSVLIPLLAVLTGLIFGAIFIILTSQEVYNGFGQSFGAGLTAMWDVVARSYTALFTGALGDPVRMINALQSGNALEIRRAFNPFLESLVTSTPYIFAGLAVALGFRAGVFNIGAEGQLFMGAITATYVGYKLVGLPMIIHLPLALLAGALGGAIWGFIPGWLKAKTGGHEVINTIMMNYIAFRLSEWLLTGPMKRPGSYNPVSPEIQPSAWLPRFFEDPIRFHLGFFLALGMAYVVYWFLFKTTWGFELRTVGSNPYGAKYAGMDVTKNTVLAMTLSGALAGLAGANEVLGVNHSLAMAFSSGYGFDSIALALLGNNHPVGVVLASLLFGTLRNGATSMQLSANVPNDIISVLQAVILAFIAAPAIIRSLYRLRKPAEGEGMITIKGWGG
ncbi:ABC transporter permease [Thermanaerothrix daxensis]|uniref:ABC transporter permease n=1 Tax=Thermanaerothrix daxensis TaxID=869279 RepID=UPI0006C901FF|nr:ABC transporter permease [Thermanaerothrix daxensis]